MFVVLIFRSSKFLAYLWFLIWNNSAHMHVRVEILFFMILIFMFAYIATKIMKYEHHKNNRYMVIA